MIEVKLWILGGLVVVLVPSIGYLLAREFSRKDQLAGAVQDLNKAVAALTLAVEEMRSWSVDKFVGWEEHKEEMARMREDIREHAERFEKDLENCAKRCPVR